MRIKNIKTQRDAIVCAVGITLICVLVMALAISAVYYLAQPTSAITYILSACLIIAIMAPIVVGIMALNVLHVQKMRDELEQQAHADPLTGLLNRRAFNEALAREHRRMARTKSNGAIILIDLDHFKHINDLHGHCAGDLVLKAVADALKSGLRPSMDYVARWGGEEFIALLTHTDLKGAKTAADRLCRTIEELDPSIGKICIGVTASFGVTELQSGASFDEIIDQADRCLYEAKKQGRNKVVSSKLNTVQLVA